LGSHFEGVIWKKGVPVCVDEVKPVAPAGAPVTVVIAIGGARLVVWTHTDCCGVPFNFQSQTKNCGAPQTWGAPLTKQPPAPIAVVAKIPKRTPNAVKFRLIMINTSKETAEVSRN
jgi:hypothetical protein